MYGPLAVTRSVSSGISVKLKPEFQKEAIGASAAASSDSIASSTACLASSASSMSRDFSAMMWAGSGEVKTRSQSTNGSLKVIVIDRPSSPISGVSVTRPMPESGVAPESK